MCVPERFFLLVPLNSHSAFKKTTMVKALTLCVNAWLNSKQMGRFLFLTPLILFDQLHWIPGEHMESRDQCPVPLRYWRCPTTATATRSYVGHWLPLIIVRQGTVWHVTEVMERTLSTVAHLWQDEVPPGAANKSSSFEINTYKSVYSIH